MFPSDQRVPFHELFIRHLLLAGWIDGSHFIPEKGYRLDWLTAGRQRVMLLQELIRTHGLKDGPSSKAFTQRCQREDRLASEPAEAILRDFWLACLEELSIGDGEESLAAFVAVIDGWVPAPPGSD